ncbi:MAG: GNAT family N-acetyltransferase [Deltaproteobacteria bacterium]|uniref:GNAT family N-acetyltransferase n=1 Tax=Candidatus Zymogenus saltonus TaxID=2844893 RepID=A0A9D8KIJ5_9DELT|nr:GNAT family N-acetyltransferase [Candidatus Zymogenus saltonus]
MAERDGKTTRIKKKILDKYPEKFLPEEEVFKKIHPGDNIFIGTGCGFPKRLIHLLIARAKMFPESSSDAVAFRLITLGVTPIVQYKFTDNFSLTSFFIRRDTKRSVNIEKADFIPIFYSNIPGLIRMGSLPIDVALIQTSMPDERGIVNLGISVDIVKAAVENAGIVIAQANSNMPRVHGEGYIDIEEVDYIIPFDEPLLEYVSKVPGEIAQKVGKYVASIIRDGDTIQVGYGSLPNAILANLTDKKNLGVHTDLLTDGIVDLMKEGVIDNSKKGINRGKTIATFCMGTEKTYRYLDENPWVEFKGVDYTNHPLTIAKNNRMTAINSALKIDLTGQATAESYVSFDIPEKGSAKTDPDGKKVGGESRGFHTWVGGQADFMRGAVLSRGGKSILSIQSTADGERVSRIVPLIEEGVGVMLNRSDVHYVVTEYGIAYIHSKNIRERAMELIAIAHPKFRGWLIEEAKRLKMIYEDQLFVPGAEGEYPEHYAQCRNTKTGLKILFRPVKLTDEPILKDFINSCSKETLYKRFFSSRTYIPHEILQKYTAIDYTKEMVIVAVVERETREVIIAMGQYKINAEDHTGDAAIMVLDEYHGRGIGTEISNYLIYLARRQGLVAFTADVLHDNDAMLHIFEKSGFEVEMRSEQGAYKMRLNFGE